MLNADADDTDARMFNVCPRIPLGSSFGSVRSAVTEAFIESKNMNLKRKEMFIERRADEDRRTVNGSLWKNNVERRKRPDRRLAGLDVDMFDISNDEFIEMFACYIK